MREGLEKSLVLLADKYPDILAEYLNNRIPLSRSNIAGFQRIL